MPSRAVKLRKINEAQSGKELNNLREKHFLKNIKLLTKLVVNLFEGTPLEPLSSDREDSPTSSPRSSKQQGPSGPSHIGRVDRVTKVKTNLVSRISVKF